MAAAHGCLHSLHEAKCCQRDGGAGEQGSVAAAWCTCCHHQKGLQVSAASQGNAGSCSPPLARKMRRYGLIGNYWHCNLTRGAIRSQLLPICTADWYGSFLWYLAASWRSVRKVTHELVVMARIRSRSPHPGPPPLKALTLYENIQKSSGSRRSGRCGVHACGCMFGYASSRLSFCKFVNGEVALIAGMMLGDRMGAALLLLLLLLSHECLTVIPGVHQSQEGAIANGLFHCLSGLGGRPGPAQHEISYYVSDRLAMW